MKATKLTTESTTEEKNTLIAEFMGYEKIVFTETSKYLGQYTNPISKRVYEVEDLEFDTDWNWLMDVVKKIEGIKVTEVYGEFNEKEAIAEISISIEGNFCQILSNGLYLNEVSSIEGATKIEATYNACVEFIEWYNEQQKTL
jgi:hypothetical protein